jgi:hypothetical protein
MHPFAPDESPPRLASRRSDGRTASRRIGAERRAQASLSQPSRIDRFGALDPDGGVKTSAVLTHLMNADEMGESEGRAEEREYECGREREGHDYGSSHRGAG